MCPGSRSAPVAFAVAAAERAGLLRVHVRYDERAAAFLALGLGAGGGPPAVVVTTSGTAVANLHPAVWEAWHSAVPMILATANRPAYLHGTWANQTTEHQRAVFGDAVRLRLELEVGWWPESMPATTGPQPPRGLLRQLPGRPGVPRWWLGRVRCTWI
ncbi:MAG: hypothetical protein CSB46_09980 [Micrococcales bacterium]|nr:MAG: hypothetical protein CSB46_09980 [Micrococcales bacterium]